MRKNISVFLSLLVLLTMFSAWPNTANALNVIYLTEQNKSLDLKPSALIVSRDENRTVLSLSPQLSYEGKKLAALIPVRNLVSPLQVKIGNKELANKLFKYTAPRINVYQDIDVCSLQSGAESNQKYKDTKFYDFFGRGTDQKLAVEYEIIRSEQLTGDNLKGFLKDSELVLSDESTAHLKSFTDADADFVFVSVFVKEQENKIKSFPFIQIAYESENFKLPLALSSTSQVSAQDLAIIFLTRRGVVKSESLPAKYISTSKKLPLFTRESFTGDYSDFLDHFVVQDNFQSVFYEYYGDAAWCPSCDKTQILSKDEYRQLGVWWFDKEKPRKAKSAKTPLQKPEPKNLYLTRYFIRHTNKNAETAYTFELGSDKNRYHVGYETSIPYLGDVSCEDGRLYQKNLSENFAAMAENYSTLSGVTLDEALGKMDADDQSLEKLNAQLDNHWWERMWNLEK